MERYLGTSDAVLLYFQDAATPGCGTSLRKRLPRSRVGGLRICHFRGFLLRKIGGSAVFPRGFRGFRGTAGIVGVCELLGARGWRTDLWVSADSRGFPPVAGRRSGVLPSANLGVRGWRGPPPPQSGPIGLCGHPSKDKARGNDGHLRTPIFFSSPSAFTPGIDSSGPVHPKTPPPPQPSLRRDRTPGNGERCPAGRDEEGF